MLRRNKKGCEQGIHKFNVLETFNRGENLMQLLQCQDCQRKFLGYSGTYGNPKWIHLLSEKSNPLITSNVNVSDIQML